MNSEECIGYFEEILQTIKSVSRAEIEESTNKQIKLLDTYLNKIQETILTQ